MLGSTGIGIDDKSQLMSSKQTERIVSFTVPQCAVQKDLLIVSMSCLQVTTPSHVCGASKSHKGRWKGMDAGMDASDDQVRIGIPFALFICTYKLHVALECVHEEGSNT